MALADALTAAEFYGDNVFGMPWGDGHRGLDILRAASRPVPHLFPGSVVVRRSSNSELGGFVVDDRGDQYQGQGRYIGYGHVVGGSGEDLGHVANYNENHGSKWSDPHVHLTVSDSPYGIDTPGLATYDPLPFVLAAIRGSDAGVAVGNALQARRRNEENTMFIRGTADVTYAVWREGTEWRMVECPPNIAAFARAGGLVITGNDPTLTGAGVESGWKGGSQPAYAPPTVSATLALTTANQTALASKIAAAIGKVPTVTEIGAACLTAFRTFFTLTK